MDGAVHWVGRIGTDRPGRDPWGNNRAVYPTILIGVDGATFKVLDALMAAGEMPVLASFVRRGARAELLSTPHPLTPPAWTTLVTGQSPGRHGIFDFIWAEHRDASIYFTLHDSRDVRAETIWSMVSRQRGRCITLNFPFMAPPPANVAGVIVPGLISWKHLRRNVRPAELYAEMQALPDFDAKELAWDFAREKQATELIPPHQHADWVDFHIRRERHWYKIFLHAMRRHPADLMAILVDGVDKLQHVCWKHLDPAHPVDQLSETERHVRERCIQYFRELDGFIAQVLSQAPPGSRVFMASDHGFGPTQKVFRLNCWLHERGYLSWTDTESLDEAERQKIEKLTTGHFVHLDWKHTTAYAQSAATNGVHIRVSRKPGDGGIDAGQYESFRRRLIDELLAYRDPQSGQQIVTRVLKKEDAFPGEHNERCPDLTLQLFDYGFISTGNKQPALWTRPDVAGTHNPEGIFLAGGPGIAAGRTLPQQSITDVAATLLHSLGLPIPSDLESRVIEDAFDATFLRAQPVTTGASTSAAEANGRTEPVEIDHEEEAVIMERLRALGYVE